LKEKIYCLVASKLVFKLPRQLISLRHLKNRSNFLSYFTFMNYLEHTLTYPFMKKMRFTLASLLLVGFLATSLMTSCGGKKEEGSETTDSTTTEQAAEHPEEGEHPAGGGEHPAKDSTSGE
jgi:hypothetical protein